VGDPRGRSTSWGALRSGPAECARDRKTVIHETSGEGRWANEKTRPPASRRKKLIKAARAPRNTAGETRRPAVKTTTAGGRQGISRGNRTQGEGWPQDRKPGPRIWIRILRRNDRREIKIEGPRVAGASRFIGRDEQRISDSRPGRCGR